MSCPNCAKIHAAEHESPESAKRRACRERLFLLISFVALIAGFAIAQSGVHVPAFPLTDPSWIAVVLCGAPIFHAAWTALVRERRITSSLLISSAIVATLALQFFSFFFGNADGGAHTHDSYIFAAGEISFLMALGEMIEEWTVKKSRKGIEALVALTPKLAHKKNANGEPETVPAETLHRGDIVFVRPDDMIPADGEIVEGSSSVNQANLTGESVPVDKGPGDEVFAGTWNRSGALTVRVTKANAENTISRLVRLVREAEEKKAPVQRIADRWAARIVPAAIVCAILVALFAHFALGTSFQTALIRGVTILVVFCPCAFALATPTAVAAGVGNLARRGILVKSGDALERLAGIDVVAFDKTGTLTRAELRVEAFFSAGRLSEKEALALCAAAEQRSQHPIARAIVKAADGLSLPTARNIASKTGVGIACDIDDEEIFVCSFSALEKDGVAVPAEAKNFADSRRACGETLICLVADGTLEGVFSLSDSLRENVPAMLSALRERGISSVVLTGDNAAAANRIGKIAGADEIFAELFPEEKSAKISEIRARGKRVLMVGDGVNDAPALAAADCSAAMGALGSELAVETADVAVLNDDIGLIPGLLKFSQAALRTIHVNFAISLCINFLSIVLSATGTLDPVSGAIVHNASSLIVVSHSALLIFRRKDFEKSKSGK